VAKKSEMEIKRDLGHTLRESSKGVLREINLKIFNIGISKTQETYPIEFDKS